MDIRSLTPLIPVDNACTIRGRVGAEITSMHQRRGLANEVE